MCMSTIYLLVLGSPSSKKLLFFLIVEVIKENIYDIGTGSKNINTKEKMMNQTGTVYLR